MPAHGQRHIDGEILRLVTHADDPEHLEAGVHDHRTRSHDDHPKPEEQMQKGTYFAMAMRGLCAAGVGFLGVSCLSGLAVLVGALCVWS